MLREQAEWEFWEREANEDGGCEEGFIGGVECVLAGTGGITAGRYTGKDIFSSKRCFAM